jgi:hypothetical protein
MKVLAIAAIFAITATVYAQVAQTSHGANSPNIHGTGNVSITQAPPHGVPGAGAPPPTVQTPPQPPPANAVEPKHSEATATLRAVEAEKATLLSQQQGLVNQVNTLMSGIRDKISAKEAEAADWQKKIREENGWGDEYVYTPPQPLPDGTTSLGKWQKTEKPKK